MPEAEIICSHMILLEAVKLTDASWSITGPSSISLTHSPFSSTQGISRNTAVSGHRPNIETIRETDGALIEVFQ